MDYKKILLFVTLAAFGIAARLMPHFPDATPMDALIITSSIYLGKRWSFILPLIILAASDVVIGFYDWRLMVSVYGSFLLIALFNAFLQKYQGLRYRALTIVGASVFFFLSTNLAVWAFSPWYEKSIAGLLLCYSLGLPFLFNMMIGDFIYTAILLGALGWIRLPEFIRKPLTSYAH